MPPCFPTYTLRRFAVSTPSGVPHCCTPTSTHRDRGRTARRTRILLVSEDEIAALGIQAGDMQAHRTTLTS